MFYNNETIARGTPAWMQALPIVSTQPDYGEEKTMRVANVPSLVRRALRPYAEAFTPAQFEHFQNYVVGLLLVHGVQYP